MLASRRVRQIINSLIQGQKTLTELAGELSISKPALLKHIREMESASMVKSDQIKTDGGRETRYRLMPFSLIASAREGFGLIAESKEIDFEFPLLCQIPGEKRNGVKQALARIAPLSAGSSILLAGEEFILLSDEWKEEAMTKVSGAAAPTKCIFWRYADMEANDSFTLRIREQAIVLRARDEKAFRNLGRYEKLEVIE